MDEILKEMQKIGFTSYESKIYLALLHRNPATGYEISKISGVPQAKVYENILRLGNRGAVLNVGNDPVKYVPLPPEKLLNKVNIDFEKSIDLLKAKLPPLSSCIEPDYVWNIRGYFSSMEKASQLIKEAKNKICLAIWGEDVMYLYNELSEAVTRGVETSILIYGRKNFIGLENVCYCGGEKKLLKTAGGRWITLVTDGKEVLTGQIAEDKEGISIWTSNPAIVYTSKRYIDQEIFMSKTDPSDYE
ncbi:MAG TPA: helix-turn-helix domain-containing protein [Clostridiaceae bacterium]